MAGKMHIVKMLGMSDEDAAVVVKDVTAAFSDNRRMSDAIEELAAKYGDASVMAGLMASKVLDRNDRMHQYGKSFEEFVDVAAVFAVAFGMSDDESKKVCEEVGNFTVNNLEWKTAFAGVGRMFGERAVYAGAFLMFLYIRAEGDLKKKYDFGHG